MKYHLDTIPVWDAIHEEKECPLCILKNKMEKSYVDSFLGGSVMEPATRIEVNEKGFCADHNILLYKAQNRLGHALMTHTHLVKTLENMKKQAKKLQKEAVDTMNAPLSISIIRKVSGKKTDLEISLNQMSTWLRNHRDRCIICDRIENSINRYAYTILHLWEHDQEFRKLLQASKGFCFSHLADVMDIASETLNTKKQGEFFAELMPVQMENLDRLEKELWWFTQKFDYKNQEEPWGNSKDAVPRTLQKLTGEYME